MEKATVKKESCKIITEHGQRQYLGKLFNVSQPTVRKALAGTSHTKLAMRIRKAAMEGGAVESK